MCCHEAGSNICLCCVTRGGDLNTKLSRLRLRGVREGGVNTHKIKEDGTDRRRERGEARVNVVSLARKIVVLRARLAVGGGRRS
jgi:hypothetical protein